MERKVHRKDDLVANRFREGRRRVLSPGEIERLVDVARLVFGSRPEVVVAYLYGSVVRGEAAEDIDMAVLLRKDSEDARILEEMASTIQLLGAPHGPDIDMRSLRGAGPRFRVNVLKGGRIIFERDQKERWLFEARSVGEWLDFKPTWERMRNLLFKRWTNG